MQICTSSPQSEVPITVSADTEIVLLEERLKELRTKWLKGKRTDTKGMEIIFPSDEQKTIAPARDFYVIGKFPNGVPSGGTLIIQLSKVLEDGSTQLVRVLANDKMDDADDLNINYSRLSYYDDADLNREKVKQAHIPDLVYDPSNPDTMSDTWRKCYYNSQYFWAEMNGGTYAFDVTPADYFGIPIKPLEEGTYEICACVQYNNMDSQDLYAFKNVNIKYADAKILSRFSPNEHMEKVTAEAKKHGYTMFLDPFPGFWSSDIIPGVDSFFAEILPKWRLADSQEYNDGDVHFYIYNVKDSSATYCVEVGQLTTDSAVESDRVFYYHYDIGEPSIGELQGSFVPFEDGATFAVTRIDHVPSSASVSDNILDINDLPNWKSDCSLNITVTPGETILINGVCKPIKSATMLNKDRYEYTILKRAQDITYSSSSTLISEVSKPVGISRMNLKLNRLDEIDILREGRTIREALASGQSSILEFSHVINIPPTLNAKDVVTLTLSARDSFGKLLPGAVAVTLTAI